MTSPPPTAAPEIFRTLRVAASDAGKRLDRFLVDSVPDLSRARVRNMIDEGSIRLNGRRARKGDAVLEGATVDLLRAPPARDFAPEAQPEAPLVIRYEDARVVVVEKPAGMPTHPLRVGEKDTLANAIVARYPSTQGVGFAAREPGLLHRLDTETSGLVLVALDAEAFATLRESSRQGRITKRYLAVVEGTVAAEARVDYPLVPHRKDPKRVEAVTPHVRLRAGTKTHEAHTHYRPLRALSGPHGEAFTLVEVELTTAFRHQVRVHLSTVGHALLGDVLYRGPNAPEGISLPRHFLHATEIDFPDLASGEMVTVRSPLPDELQAALDALSPW